MPQSPGALLRQAVAQGTIQVPGAPNALLARLIERQGFPAAYLSGAAVSAGVLALPDIGLMTLTELVQQTRYAANSVAIPLIVDADTGFGKALNIERTVSELECAGAAAIQLEDQQLPKRCGHLSGKTLVEADAMSAKIRAAVAAREVDELVIIARTDARGVTGLDDAIERAKEYVGAGADWIFPEALADRDEFARFAEAVNVPLVANMTEFGKSPLLGIDELTALGYAAVLYPVTLLRVAMQAAQSALVTIASEGTQTSLLDAMQTRDELYQLLKYETFDQRDRAYFQTQRRS
jgi:methylisocitrate lyase